VKIHLLLVSVLSEASMGVGCGAKLLIVNRSLLLTSGTFLISKMLIIFSMNVHIYIFSPHNDWSDCTNWSVVV
jgi:hypothetical protein